MLGTLTLTAGPLSTGPVHAAHRARRDCRPDGRSGRRLSPEARRRPGSVVARRSRSATRPATRRSRSPSATVTTRRRADREHDRRRPPRRRELRHRPDASVNRFWTVTNAGIVFDTYDATFTFVGRRHRCRRRIRPCSSSPSATARPGRCRRSGRGPRLSTQATGMTSFSDFAVGEPTRRPRRHRHDGLASVTAGDGLTHGYTITVTNGGPVRRDGGQPDRRPGRAASARARSAPSPGQLRPGRRRPRLQLRPGHDRGRRRAPRSSVAYTVPAAPPAGVQTDDRQRQQPGRRPDPGQRHRGRHDDRRRDRRPSSSPRTTARPASSPATAWPRLHDHGHQQRPVRRRQRRPRRHRPGAFTAGVPSADLGGDCTASIGNTIACTLPASLAAGATWTITVPYTVGAAVTRPDRHQHRRRHERREPRRRQRGATSTDVDRPAPTSAVTVSDGLASVTAGDGLTHGYTITVTNGGPSDATAVSLTVTWPSGFSQGTISPSQGSCAPIGAGPDFSCALGTIARRRQRRR